MKHIYEILDASTSVLNTGKLNSMSSDSFHKSDKKQTTNFSHVKHMSMIMPYKLLQAYSPFFSMIKIVSKFQYEQFAATLG